ncbi:MAG: hypothetical protein JRI23_02715 [Deltaproteobacteria bacterium]|jgi:hypothetical protein|nr:hypothetical protein [Deltaproteobacteria bacterium]MBW2530413.1 hypothetical protein [Deltaproteobacteria bacterium]
MTPKTTVAVSIEAEQEASKASPAVETAAETSSAKPSPAPSATEPSAPSTPAGRWAAFDPEGMGGVGRLGSILMMEDVEQQDAIDQGKAPARAKPSPLCATAVAANARRIRALLRGFDPVRLEKVVENFSRCWPSGRGAWVIRPLALRRQLQKYQPELYGKYSGRIVGRWQLVHVTAAGGVAPGPREAAGDYVWWDLASYDYTGYTFDYDGDGSLELALRVSHVFGTADEHPAVQGRLWTLRRQRIAPYPTPMPNITHVRDFDGDGRPDLLGNGVYEADYGEDLCSVTMHSSRLGPFLIGHSLPDGSFSLNDGVATEFARAQCPVPPAGAVLPVPSPPPRSPPDWKPRVRERELLRVRCARLWGMSVRDVRAGIRVRCDRPLPCPRSGPERDPPLGSCHLHRRLIEWAEAMPPLDLRPRRDGQPPPTATTP